MNLTDEQIQQRFEALWPEFTQQVRRSFGGRQAIYTMGETPATQNHGVRLSISAPSDSLAKPARAYIHYGLNGMSAIGALTSEDLRALAAQAIAASIEIDANTEGK